MHFIVAKGAEVQPQTAQGVTSTALKHFKGERFLFFVVANILSAKLS